MKTIKFRAWDMHFNMMLNDLHIYDSFNEKITFKDRYVIEQFTGLHDKSGKEIYEGDIVRAHAFYFDGNEAEREFVGTVMYSDWCSFGIQDAKPRYGSGGWYEFSDTSHFEDTCIEVLGNIHENPDLIP